MRLLAPAIAILLLVCGVASTASAAPVTLTYSALWVFEEDEATDPLFYAAMLSFGVVDRSPAVLTIVVDAAATLDPTNPFYPNAILRTQVDVGSLTLTSGRSDLQIISPGFFMFTGTFPNAPILPGGLVH